MAMAQSARFLELRAAVDLARYWKYADRATKARVLLEPVYGWCTAGFSASDLHNAEALLAPPGSSEDSDSRDHGRVNH